MKTNVIPRDFRTYHHAAIPDIRCKSRPPPYPRLTLDFEPTRPPPRTPRGEHTLRRDDERRAPHPDDLAGGGSAALRLHRPRAAGLRPPAKVRIALNPGVGYESAAAVLAYLLEHELGYEVERTEMTEAEAWKGFESGTVDVIVENWGREAEKRNVHRGEEGRGVSRDETATKGTIGWYVPQWMVQKIPDITDWRNLNKYAHLFRDG